ncbi:MAG: hypothetical protein U9N59_07030 [Campylobacterota bacterium]|nr:hypothetical protein [Campylobacterota bacterium]
MKTKYKILITILVLGATTYLFINTHNISKHKMSLVETKKLYELKKIKEKYINSPIIIKKIEDSAKDVRITNKEYDEIKKLIQKENREK